MSPVCRELFLAAAGALALLFQPWLAARPSWRADAGWGLVLPSGLRG